MANEDITDRTIGSLLGSDTVAVAIGLFQSPPEGVAKWQGGPVPAGCAFWREAQKGRTFYTVPEDHYNCAVGCHVHSIALPESREQELMETVGFMVESNYISMDEVPTIPKLGEAPAVIAYGPVEKAVFTPAVVVAALEPADAMLLYEAALAAGAATAPMGALGRPACAVIPLTAGSKTTSLSLGCRGNRLFAGLGDDKLYVCVEGSRWNAVLERLEAVLAANQTMARHYESKKAAIASI
jgi:uncharacterized protein (DUF169 family)